MNPTEEVHGTGAANPGLTDVSGGTPKDRVMALFRASCGSLGIVFADQGDKLRAGFKDDDARYAPGYALFMLCDGMVAKVICSSDFRVPLSCRRLASKFLAHVNFAMQEGHFQMDISDGELRFVTSFVNGDASGFGEITKHMIKLGVHSYSPVANALATLCDGHKAMPEACLDTEIASTAAAAVAAM